MQHQLDTLIERGTLSRAEAEDDVVFLRDVALGVALGELTEEQAFALCGMLGFARGQMVTKEN